MPYIGEGEGMLRGSTSVFHSKSAGNGGGRTGLI